MAANIWWLFEVLGQVASGEEMELKFFIYASK